MKKLEVVLDTVYDVFQFLLKTIDDNLVKDSCAYAYVGHLASPFFASKRDFKKIKAIQKKGKVHYICKSDSPFDQILAQFYKGFSSKVKLGIDLKLKSDVYIVNDLIISVSIPSKVTKQIDELYFDTKSVLSFNMIKFFKRLADDKAKIKVVVLKNKKEAEKLRLKFIKFL